MCDKSRPSILFYHTASWTSRETFFYGLLAMLSYSTRVQDGKVNIAKSRLTFEMLSVNGVNKREWAECASALDKRDWVWDLRVGSKATHSEGGICPELQQTLDSRQAQVGRGDVQGRAEVKVAAGGVDLCGDTGVTHADIFFSMWHVFLISHPQPNWRAQTFPLRWKKKPEDSAASLAVVGADHRRASEANSTWQNTDLAEPSGRDWHNHYS